MSLKTILTFFLFSTIACSLVYTNTYTQIEEKWLSYKNDFKKSYPNQSEDLLRKINFINTLKRIETVNAEYGEGYLGLNKFADYHPHELRSGIQSNENFSRYFPKNNQVQNISMDLTTRFGIRQSDNGVDWRNFNAVTVPKNQRVHGCGSCWAFAGASILESAWRLYRKGELMSMSNQQLLDCTQPGNNGQPITNDCSGNGRAEMALQQLKDRGETLVREECYRAYSGRKNQCQRPWGNCEGGRLDSDAHIRINYDNSASETEMENWIRQLGPVAAKFKLHAAFYNFNGGRIWDGPCDYNNGEDHIVAVVGFTRDYWIVKNSYGTDWADQGYFHLRKGQRTCNIGSDYIQLYYH